MKNEEAGLRAGIAKALHWGEARATLEAAVADLPSELRGHRPGGLPHSAWELLEHMRIAQRDLLDFCRAGEYRERTWPDDYWPASPAPESEDAWKASVEAVLEDRAALAALAEDPSIDLLAPAPHATRPEQSYLRALLLALDHAAYHVGQLVLVRRALGDW